MNINILSCGIFRPELDIIIPEIKQELKNCDIMITYLAPGLHNDCKKMEEELTKNLEKIKSTKILLLYGSMCHTELPAILKNYDTVFPKEKNCVEIILKPEIKMEMDNYGNIFYLTAGWLKNWKEIFPRSIGETIIGDKVVYLDCGTNLVSDEEILDFFDFANLPIETEKITLDNFKEIIIKLCGKLLESLKI
jgi:hypothetical protein